MKYFILLGALLLPVLPAFADDFVYLKCENQMKLTSTEIKTGKLINDGETKFETVFLKIDPVGSRFMSYKPSSDHKEPNWDDATIAGGVLSATMVDKNEALEVNGEISVEFQPAGKLSSQLSAIVFGMISTQIEITGHCVDEVSSVFEKAFKVPGD